MIVFNGFVFGRDLALARTAGDRDAGVSTVVFTTYCDLLTSGSTPNVICIPTLKKKLLSELVSLRTKNGSPISSQVYKMAEYFGGMISPQFAAYVEESHVCDYSEAFIFKPESGVCNNVEREMVTTYAPNLSKYYGIQENKQYAAKVTNIIRTDQAEVVSQRSSVPVASDISALSILPKAPEDSSMDVKRTEEKMKKHTNHNTVCSKCVVKYWYDVYAAIEGKTNKEGIKCGQTDLSYQWFQYTGYCLLYYIGMHFAPIVSIDNPKNVGVTVIPVAMRAMISNVVKPLSFGVTYEPNIYIKARSVMNTGTQSKLVMLTIMQILPNMARMGVLRLNVTTTLANPNNREDP